MKKVTIQNVADTAGVSPSTVSGILNNSGKQNSKTIARVTQVIEELGYQPRRNKLRHKNTKRKAANLQIGLLFPDTNKAAIHTPLSTALINGIQTVLSEEDCQLRILTLNHDGSLPDLIKNSDIDALIIRSGHALKESEIRHIPCVYVFQNSNYLQCHDGVLVDNTLCGESGASYAIDCKVKNATIIEPDSSYHLSLQIRSLAFECTLKEKGINYKRIVIDQLTDAAISQTDCLFIPGHDQQARKIIKQLKKHGDEKVLITVMTEDINFQLKTNIHHYSLHIDPERIGAAAAKQLLWRRENPRADFQRTLIPPIELNRKFDDKK
ncbi:MAG: LacI family DNA-binding transcriptional regulator [Lentisphaeria bacterium]|nr:LacI family DNA-binding transcriptional regulator [Lentisphaeria bacterium]